MIRVAVVEDREEIREGLTALLNGTGVCRVEAAFRSMEDAIPAIDARRADVVLVDIGLPGMSGIEGIRVLHERFPDLVLLVLTVYEDDERIFAALCAGASGYLLKKTPPARLLESIQDAVGGGAPMSPEIARRVVEFFHGRRAAASAMHPLTSQEKRLLQLLVEGHHYKTAAAQMGISVNTVSFHLRRIYEKLQVHSKSEAVAKALRDGLAR
ncbi:MAG TPA: response regulator transcription factor [Thermoanaerobaculia bacterium]|nr:response regulator transcription factor [Thermoanaerobaculia bacterium]